MGRQWQTGRISQALHGKLKSYPDIQNPDGIFLSKLVTKVLIFLGSQSCSSQMFVCLKRPNLWTVFQLFYNHWSGAWRLFFGHFKTGPGRPSEVLKTLLVLYSHTVLDFTYVLQFSLVRYGMSPKIRLLKNLHLYDWKLFWRENSHLRLLFWRPEERCSPIFGVKIHFCIFLKVLFFNDWVCMIFLSTVNFLLLCCEKRERTSLLLSENPY